MLTLRKRALAMQHYTRKSEAHIAWIYKWSIHVKVQHIKNAHSNKGNA